MITLAVAGFGWWGQHLGSRLAPSDKVRIGVVVEPDPERKALARERGFETVDDYDAALARDDVDAVVLTSPNRLHEPQTLAAAAAGKHVFCEKPFAMSPAGARRSIDACVAAGVVVGVGHERRFEPAVQRVVDMIRNGELGTVMHAEANFSHDRLRGVPAGDWRTMKATAPAAAMTAMGIHLTDLLIALFGPVDSLAAFTADRVLGWETGDVVTAQLRFVAGMTATFSAILCTPHYIRLQVFGSRRWVEVINATHPDTPGGTVELTVQESGAEPVLEHYPWTDAVRANVEAFADAVDGRAPYPVSHDEIVHNIELLSAIERSAAARTVERCGAPGKS